LIIITVILSHRWLSAEKIIYYAGKGRFVNWPEETNDWNLSRSSTSEHNLLHSENII